MPQINVRLTDAEYAALATEAARVSMSPTAYLTAAAREENGANGMTLADVLIDRAEAAAEIKRRPDGTPPSDDDIDWENL